MAILYMEKCKHDNVILKEYYNLSNTVCQKPANPDIPKFKKKKMHFLIMKEIYETEQKT